MLTALYISVLSLLLLVVLLGMALFDATRQLTRQHNIEQGIYERELGPYVNRDFADDFITGRPKRRMPYVSGNAGGVR